MVIILFALCLRCVPVSISKRDQPVCGRKKKHQSNADDHRCHEGNDREKRILFCFCFPGCISADRRSLGSDKCPECQHQHQIGPDSTNSVAPTEECPDFVIARAGTARGNPFPVFNVFKWQFENTAILHFAFPPGRGAAWRTLCAATGGSVACCLLPVACCLLPERAACPLYFLFLAFTKAANCLTSSYISSVISVSPPKSANLMSSSSTTVSVPGRGREALSLSMR